MTYLYPFTQNSNTDVDFYQPTSQPVPNEDSYWAEKTRGISNPIYQEIAVPSDFPASETNTTHAVQPRINSPIEDFSFEFMVTNINHALTTGQYLSTHTNPPPSKDAPNEIKENYIKKLSFNLENKQNNLKSENDKIDKFNFIKRLLEINKDNNTSARNKINNLSKELNKSFHAVHHYYYNGQRIIKQAKRKIKRMNQQKIDPQKIIGVIEEAIAPKIPKKRLNKK